ncbi:unnamed protein product [Chironomus riparius]|uniref:Uncharacterized protein n=1 Tax=Chironomus riparius TaxID=315576 RepID=A0A9N9S3N1_9DIPT|nr:unnamed protein product [Chironomus riparius]
MDFNQDLDPVPPNNFEAGTSDSTVYIILGIIFLLVIIWIMKVCCKGVNFIDFCWFFKNCCTRSEEKEVPENQNEVIFIQDNDKDLMSSIPVGNLNNEVIVLDCGDQVLTDENIQQILSRNGTSKSNKSSRKN